MPSKSDIQFGKIVVANSFASKEQVEEALKIQYRFEKKKSKTSVIEPFLLHFGTLDPARIKAIQEKMHRRVIFCSKCSGKFNISQFAGGEKFMCNKCNSKIEVPDFASYVKWLKGTADEVAKFMESEKELDAAAPPIPSLEVEASKGEKDTVVIQRSDVETLDPEEEVDSSEGLDLAKLPKDSGNAAKAAPEDVIELEDAEELETGEEKAPTAPAAPAAPAKPAKSAKDIARKIAMSKKEAGQAAAAPAAKPKEEQDLVYALDGSTLKITAGTEAAFASKAPALLPALFSGKSCTISISSFAAASRDSIKLLRDEFKRLNGKAKVRLELTKEQEKLAGSMTKKMFDLKIV